jgi:hypothetical protein
MYNFKMMFDNNKGRSIIKEKCQFAIIIYNYEEITNQHMQLNSINYISEITSNI